MTGDGPRVAVVGTAAIFRKRAGNAAYLASFCRVLREMGCRVELLFLDPIPADQIQLRQFADYLDSVDAVELRQSFRLNTRFITRDPKSWAQFAIKRTRSAIAAARPNRPDRARHGGLWSLPWPTHEALEWAQQRLSAFRPDIVVANYFNASRVFDVVDQECQRAILSHDIFALRELSYRASGYRPDFDAAMVEAEAEGFAAADLCLTITQSDADFVKQRHPWLRTAVFPHVVDIPKPNGRRPTGGRCVFVGSNNDPNRRALAWLLREVWSRVSVSRPDAELRIVGDLERVGSLAKAPRVVFTGPVDDLAEEYAAAAVALVPLRAGSGLKIKLVEALAHGVPVVSTKVGAQGIREASPGFLRVHDDPAGFANAIQEMIEAPNWSVRSTQARKFTEAHFSAGVAETALRRAFDGVTDGNIRDRRQPTSLLSAL